MIKRLSVVLLFAVLFLTLLIPTQIMAQQESAEAIDSITVEPIYDSLFLKEQTPLQAAG